MATVKFPKRAGKTVFYVPNNDEGRAFIEQARSYLNRRHWQMRHRGRGPRRSQGAKKNFLRLNLATYFGVYLNSPTNAKISRDAWRKTYDEIQTLRRQLNQLGTPQKQSAEITRLLKMFYRKRAIDLVN